jgi:hypothetical protein
MHVTKQEDKMERNKPDMKLQRRMSQEERDEWSEIWYAALLNMPKKSNSIGATMLYRLLGYRIWDPQGRNRAAHHYFTNRVRGSKPKDPKRQELLKQLAGPHGQVIARAIAAKRGIDLKKYHFRKLSTGG